MMALSAQVPEEDFEGMEVAVSRVAIKNTGDAISDAMDVEGLHVTLGDRVYFVLGADCVSVGFRPVKGEEDKLKRVMEFRASISATRSVSTTRPFGDSLAMLKPGSPVPAAMSRC